MKKSIIAMFILTFFSGATFASEGHEHRKKSSRNQSQGQAQSQVQGQLQAAFGGAGGAGGSAISGESSASATIAPMNFNFTAPSIPTSQQLDIHTSGKTTIRQAPAIGFQLGSPTANCLNIIGGGGSAASGGGLISFGFNVDWCKRAELSRQARNHGMEKTADDLFCSIEEVKELNTPECAESRKRAKLTLQENSVSGAVEINPAFNSK